MQEQRPELQTVSRYTQSLDKLTDFFRKVNLNIPEHGRNRVIQKCCQIMKTCFTMHKFKVIKPWCYLIQRLDAKNFGITSLHLKLLQILLQESFYNLALQLIRVPRLVSAEISLSNYQRYLLKSAFVYEQSSQFNSAEQCISIALELTCKNIDTTIILLAHLVVLRHTGKKAFSSDSLQKFFDMIVLSSEKSLEQLLQQSTQSSQVKKIKQHFEILKMITGVKQKEDLQNFIIQYEKQLTSLTVLALVKVKLKNFNLNQIREIIENRICEENLLKTKYNQIKNVSLGNFEVIKSINRENTIYKYDQISGSINFSFMKKKVNNKLLEKLIGRVVQMENNVSCSLEKYSLDKHNQRFHISRDRGFLNR